MNKQKFANDHNISDTINSANYVSISDNNINQSRAQSNNPHRQHRLLILQNQSATSSQKGSLDKKADNYHQNDNENIILSFQQYNHGVNPKSPKKLIESDYLNSLENPMNSQEEMYYIAKNVNGSKNVNHNRHKTPYQRIYVEQQSIQKQSIQNNQNSLGIQSSSQNVQNANNYRFNSQNKKELTPKNKISIEEGNLYKSNNRSAAIRDLSNEGYYKNSEENKINKVYGDSTNKQNTGVVRDQLNSILQQQNSTLIKKLNGNRHNVHTNQDSLNQNQGFNIRQIKKKSSISMNESQLANAGGSGIIANGQNSQIIVQNIKDREGSGGKIINQQNSLCKYDSIRNIHNSQESSQQNILASNNKNNSSIYQYQPENQIFQVNIYNNQERQERIQQVYLGNKLNLAKKQMSPQKEVYHNQYETIEVNNKRKAKSTQRQQSILRERKQNSNTINFIHLNQSGGSGNSGLGSNNNLSLYSLNQNQQNNVCTNSNNNNLSYESCYSSQNANKFYFRSKNNQNNSGTQSNQIQNSIVGGLPNACSQNSSQINQTINQVPSQQRRQLPQIKDTYNTIDNSATNPSSSLYKTKNVIRINGSVADKTHINRTLDAQPLSTTSKQEKTNKNGISTINYDKKIGTLNEKSNPSINATNINKPNNRKSQLNDTQLYKQIQQLNNHDSQNATIQNKINSRSQSIRRGRFQNPQNANAQNKMNSQKENYPTGYQHQQGILINNLQLQSCKHRDESSNTRQRFTSKNDQTKMIIINQIDSNQTNLQEILDVPVTQKQENVKIQLIDESRTKGYNTISIEEQKRCASQTENRPESQVQKEKQNFYKQSYAIEKIQHLKSIETGDLIPTTNKINFERNTANPIHSPILNRDSSPVPQVHTPTKKRIKNQNQVNQKIEFFPQPPPPPPPPIQTSQNQQQIQSKIKYGQKYQRGNIVKPKNINSNSAYAYQSNQNSQQYQQDNQQSSLNPNSVGFTNKHTSQVSTNIALSSNHCQDIKELKFNSNTNAESKNLFQNDNIAIDQTEESMDNLVKSLQEEVYQEIKDQEKDHANQQIHIQSLENSFYNYFTSNLQQNKPPSSQQSYSMKQNNSNLEQMKLKMEKKYSNEPEKPTINLQKNCFTKITEKNEDQVSSKADDAKKDDFIFSTLDAFNKDRRGSKAAKIIIDFDMDDDNEVKIIDHDQKNDKLIKTEIVKDVNEVDKQQVNKPKIEEQDLKINLQNSQNNLIEEPVDSGRNSPQVSKISTAIKPLYYKYNNSFHQMQQTPDDSDINDIENNQPTFEKFIKSKVSNMRNSILKQSVRYDNNFFNQSKLLQLQQQQIQQQQSQQNQQQQLLQQQQQQIQL